MQCGFIRVSNGTDSPHTDLVSVIDRKYRPISQEDITTINTLFNKYAINTKRRICAFFAQCEVESAKGERMVERAHTPQNPLIGDVNRTNLHNWFNAHTDYGHKYRGAGAIQLTWEENYEAFKKWMNTEFGINDNNITGIGTEHVAFNYPWHSAVFFWAWRGLNSLADAENNREITRRVYGSGHDNHYLPRRQIYDRWMRDFSL
jgi:predicted chitinase